MQRGDPSIRTHPDDPVMDAVARSARRVVETARDRGEAIHVDVDSLPVLDRLIDEDGFDDRRTLVTCVGCFLGQVLCEACDGVWAQDPDLGLHVRVGDLRVSPFAWVRRRYQDEDVALGERFEDLADRARSRTGFPSAR